MSTLVDWIKRNKLTAFLLAIVGFFLLQSTTNLFNPRYSNLSLSKSSSEMGYREAPGIGMSESFSGVADMIVPMPPIPQDAAPTTSDQRLVITDTNLSMVVKDVSQTVNQIQSLATEHGGYLVNSNLNRPEGAASGSITIRVASDKRDQALAGIRALGLRVVSENVNGRDVTDEYVDLEERLDILNQTKTKFETILDQAEEVSDLLEVQRELVNIQSQIDQLKGRQQYLEQSASLSRITVYLSTDELALPYAPDQVWRPTVVFKLAVRSLIGTVRDILDTGIWLAVYAVLWIPVLIIIWFFLRFRSRRPSHPPQM